MAFHRPAAEQQDAPDRRDISPGCIRIDRLKIAERLSAQRPADLPPLQVCVQVNVSGEASKSGCAPDEALALCRAVAALPSLRLRGLMAIPEPTDDFAAQRVAVPPRCATSAQPSAAPGLPLDTLVHGHVRRS